MCLVGNEDIEVQILQVAPFMNELEKLSIVESVLSRDAALIEVGRQVQRSVKAAHQPTTLEAARAQVLLFARSVVRGPR